MCYQAVERYSACRCLYYRFDIAPCAANARLGHSVTEKTVLVGFACSIHSNDHAKRQSSEQAHTENMLEHEQQHAATTRNFLDISAQGGSKTARTFDSLRTIQAEGASGETESMLNCPIICDKFGNRADFKNSATDIDNLHIELRSKICCSLGVTMDHKDVEELSHNLREPQQTTNDGNLGDVGTTECQVKRARRPKRSPRNQANARVQKRPAIWRQQLAMISEPSEDDLTASDSQASSFKNANGRSNRGYRGPIHQSRDFNTIVGKVKYNVSENTTKDDDTLCRALFQALGCRVPVRGVCRA
ncbi:hypothetical protein FB567DRAFT_542984 [Paraphoma chrysanthemicola]|uniref:Transcription factor PAP1 domain-containing protein n=1 Tax=Paraphoma chrysanthemicola TaxID=798071 RepID=A0A8K0RJU0_9PLEO|nr:hypothetical protein FB567DRAFT_542984 [Paraphoma chrysanthemicola]